MTETGFIFNIQKFSIHDGPGIRTTIFFKGCPLRCRWCSNPESQCFTAEPLRDPDGTISLSGKAYTLAELMAICRQDQDFYEESGGGVTLSGGEALSQAPFVIRLLDALRETGIHCALETSGYAPGEVFSEVIRRTDLILFDIKHHDRDRHREGAGEDNRLILENLRRALEAGANLLPRIPVIPGFNDAPADAEGFTALLWSLGLKRVQLLPFHRFGERKYEMLQRSNLMEGFSALYKEDLESYRAIFVSDGVECFF
jgi:pyruvate formate lyase activating enzyme